MSKAVGLREDFDADALRRLARKSRDAGQSRRLLALAGIYEGESRTQASRIGAVGLQTVRDWVLAFNAAGPDGLIERKKPGPRFMLDAAQRQALAAIIEEGPDLQRDGVVRWRLKDLAAWLFARFGVSLDESSVGREVKRMGYTKLSARPRHHQQDPAALTAFKNLPARVSAIRAQLPADTPLELWWQDEARVGQKNTAPRRWALKVSQYAPLNPHYADRSRC